ncbi:MAG: hypothetical protein ACKO9Z_05220 [Planctomycetota bacterium]
MSEKAVREKFLGLVRRFRPVRAVVLGSGMSRATDHLRERMTATWADWPGIAEVPGVSGHGGSISIKTASDGWACLVVGGRLHRYEGHSTAVTTRMLRELPGLGITEVVLTCATGGINAAMSPGTIVQVSHLLDMTDPGLWRPQAWGIGDMPAEAIPATPLANRLNSGLERIGHRLGPATLAQMSGPSYETKAEINMLRRVGADVVGMSSGHEWRAGTLAGLDVRIVALVTNWACGLETGAIHHGHVVQNSLMYSANVGAVISSH